MDRFREMEVFAAVVDAGSFVGAADALDSSKAAMSRLVSDLEARLGVRLLHRTTRRLSLTDEGRTFHARCKSLLSEVDEAEAEISARTGEARGTLRINVPVTFGANHLAPLWPAFMAKHPALILDVTTNDRLVDLVDEGYDMAVRIGSELAASSLISRKLATSQMILCASPRYLRKHGTPRHPSELASHSTIAYSLFSLGLQWPFEGPDGEIRMPIEPRMRTNSADSCRAAALADLGLILQPSFLIAEDLRAGTLVEVMPDFRSLELGVFAVYPTRQHMTPKVRLLIDYLAHSFRSPRWRAVERARESLDGIPARIDRRRRAR
jgi:DNA-binding transcriptional LysR family regulator